MECALGNLNSSRIAMAIDIDFGRSVRGAKKSGCSDSVGAESLVKSITRICGEKL